MLLSEVARVSAAVTATSARNAKIEQIAALLGRVPPGEVTVAVAFLSGELVQGQIGVGYAAVSEMLRAPATADATVRAAEDAAADQGGPAPGQEAGLTLTDVDTAFGAIGAVTGPGSQAERRRLLTGLFARATPREREFLVRLLAGDLGQGALEGVMTDAVARAAGVPAEDVRRAHQLGGSLPEVARAALGGTPRSADRALAALRGFTLRVGRPVRPMLAASAPDIAAALDRISPAAAEWKIDGIRIQVHRSGRQVAVFTRTLEDITARVPEIAEAALSLPVADAVLDGEAVALTPDGRPRPFQVTAARTASQADVARQQEQTPLTPFLFDLLHLDGADLIDAPASERHRQLSRIAPATLLTPRIVTADPAAAEAFLADAIARGHEGVVLKSLDSPYRAGRRGSEWIKVKPRHTLDLVDSRGRMGPWAAPGRAVQPAPRRARPGNRRPGHAGQDLQGPDRRDAGLADHQAARPGRSGAALARPAPTAARLTGSSGSVPNWSWRSRSTGCRPAAATRAAWPSGSPACCGSGPTRTRPRPTPSTPSARSGPRESRPSRARPTADAEQRANSGFQSCFLGLVKIGSTGRPRPTGH